MRQRPPRPCRAYVLRCWREEGESADGEASWRFSVEEIFRERRRRGFDSFARLVAFLEAELREEALPDDEGPLS